MWCNKYLKESSNNMEELCITCIQSLMMIVINNLYCQQVGPYVFYHLGPDAFTDASSVEPTPGWQQPQQHDVSGYVAPCSYAFSRDTRTEWHSETPPQPRHHHELVKNDNITPCPFLQATAPLPSQHHACAKSVAEALATSHSVINVSTRLQMKTTLSPESHSAENSLPITSHDAYAATHQPWSGGQQQQGVTHKSQPHRIGTPYAQHLEGAQTECISEGPLGAVPSGRHVTITHCVDTSHVNISDEALHHRSHSAKLEGDPHYLG